MGLRIPRRMHLWYGQGLQGRSQQIYVLRLRLQDVFELACTAEEVEIEKEHRGQLGVLLYCMDPISTVLAQHVTPAGSRR
jgi:hypothetical protein